MANTQALRRRIKTAQNISKTTRAMQMIAATKLKRAQSAVLTSRPYVNKLIEITKSVAPGKGIATQEELHPYMKTQNKDSKTLYIVISPDKGLCGGLITNLIKEYLKIRNDTSLTFITIGKKIEGPISGHKNLLASFPFGTTLPEFGMVLPVAKIVDDEYLSGRVGSVRIITTHFNSVFSQSTNIIDLLPIRIEAIDGQQAPISSNKLFEPKESILLPELLKRYLYMVLYQSLLESFASEQGARMIAMQNATDNARDIVNTLQLIYNNARQEKITKENLDISGAASAMNNE